MPTFLAPAGGWAPTGSTQGSTLPNRAAVPSLSFNPGTMPNPAVRYSDLYQMFATPGPSGQPSVFPDSSLAPLLALFASGTASPADIEALGGTLSVAPGTGSVFGVPTDTYFDLTEAFSLITASTVVSLLLSAPGALEPVAQGLCSASFRLPGQYLTKASSAGGGLPYTAASALVPVPWHRIVPLLGENNLARPLLAQTYATQTEFDSMQAQYGLVAQGLNNLADTFTAYYWGLSMGSYTPASFSNANQAIPSTLVRITVPHSIIK